MASKLIREAERALAALDAATLRRDVRPARGVDFASNDYLGLRAHPKVLEAARAELGTGGLGAGAARLLRGDHPAHRALEERVAALQGMEDGLLFSSGFLANYGVLQTLVIEGWAVVSDAWNHASIIDGCRAARGRVVIVQHNDVEAVERSLRHAPSIVVTESVFSMSGDRAPVEQLSEIAASGGASLFIDEAHALGLFPPTGTPDLRINPLGKAVGGAGAVVTGPKVVLDLLRSRCRTFLFSTALPPALAAGALAALDIIEAEPERGQRALELARRISPDAQSCIVPIPCRDNEDALGAQAFLAERGFDVRAVRPPTVPQAMLRLSVHATRTDDEIRKLTALIESWRERSIG